METGAKAILSNSILIGYGLLNWPREERISDRYGVVNLYTSEAFNEQKKLLVIKEDESGSLVALIKETRESNHIGDLFHGFFPETPRVGEIIGLGVGHIFYEGDNSVGLKPEEERCSFWLDPKALYRCHSQTVDLFFVPRQ